MADSERKMSHLEPSLTDDVLAEPALHKVLVLVQPVPVLGPAGGRSELIRGELIRQRGRGSHRVTLL